MLTARRPGAAGRRRVEALAARASEEDELRRLVSLRSMRSALRRSSDLTVSDAGYGGYVANLGRVAPGRGEAAAMGRRDGGARPRGEHRRPTARTMTTHTERHSTSSALGIPPPSPQVYARETDSGRSGGKVHRHKAKKLQGSTNAEQRRLHGVVHPHRAADDRSRRPVPRPARPEPCQHHLAGRDLRDRLRPVPRHRRHRGPPRRWRLGHRRRRPRRHHGHRRAGMACRDEPRRPLHHRGVGDHQRRRRHHRRVRRRHQRRPAYLAGPPGPHRHRRRHLLLRPPGERHSHAPLGGRHLPGGARRVPHRRRVHAAAVALQAA